MDEKKILVTGGAGFSGCNLIRHLLQRGGSRVLNLDKLVFAGAANTLTQFRNNSAYTFEQVDLCDSERLANTFREFRPDAVMHLAAETHVDRSIDTPAPFIQSNIVGTFNLLEAARAYWQGLEPASKAEFRFLHVSTDEVMGSLTPSDAPFTESSPYRPNSPYSASKAAADHLVRAWHQTFSLPVLITNCSNNYGPYQFPEKLIPLMVLKAIQSSELPVYGDGGNVRDWLFVTDHVEALCQVLDVGAVGESYNIGGSSEVSNIEVVETICKLLDEIHPRTNGQSYLEQIRFVKDRPGHDFRYAMDTRKIKTSLGWKERETFESGLRTTVVWYLENQVWINDVTGGTDAGKRLGLVDNGTDVD